MRRTQSGVGASRRVGRSQRGDTLIEVTLALAIIGSILIGASRIASAAVRQGIDARERSQVSAFIQEQAEALRNYRDSTPIWNDGSANSFIGTVSSYCAAGFIMTPPPTGNNTAAWAVAPAAIVANQPKFRDGTGVPTLQMAITCGQYLGNADEELFNITATWTNASGIASSSKAPVILTDTVDFKPCDSSLVGACP